ncbi:TniQ family protein [Streptomyces sp. RerS4]|uniref:TniQ family protein n=1 Tax=Streptomyces sp. RerS4 TaxID=2942449 RepID=UPI00201BBA1E|nr:TniQ family protein [Streptomyces sp. RerS4]UQW99181.1 TniQ family protein [Streptomyces sp. RerS4]
MPEALDARQLRPLARSLDPLEGESLSGYLLRLAHRLGVDPLSLYVRTGLTGARPEGTKITRVSTALAFSLDDVSFDAFSRTTRLSHVEVTRLLVAPLGVRYGPLSTEYSNSQADERSRFVSPWVLSDRTQYCPECLAGDRSSQIEQTHGGAWQRIWRLSAVFACLRHGRFLRQNCPNCGEQVQGETKNLIARPRDSELHPVQCRASAPVETLRAARPACGADLARSDQPRDLLPSAKRSREAVFSTQARLLALLAPDGPDHVSSVGWLIPTAQYFNDLRTVATLIFMTWPEARPHAATRTLAKILDHEAEQRHRAFENVRDTPGAYRRKVSIYVAPPENPAVTAAVLEMADRFLSAPDEREAARFLEPLAVEATYIHRKVGYALRTKPGTSFPLQVALMAHRRGESSTATAEEIITKHGGFRRAPSVCA